MRLNAWLFAFGISFFALLAGCTANNGQCRGSISGSANSACVVANTQATLPTPIVQPVVSTSALTCSAAVISSTGQIVSQVQSGQQLSIQVNAAGGVAPYSVPTLVTSFASQTTIAGSYTNSGSTNLTVTKQIQVTDSRNASAFCSLNLTILPAGVVDGGNNLACNIAVNPTSPSVGQTTQITVNVVNGSGTTTFSSLYPQMGWSNPDWAVPVTSISNSQGAVSGGIQYTQPGNRVMSTSITNNGQTVTCSSLVNVTGGNGGGGSGLISLSSTVNGVAGQVAPIGSNFLVTAISTMTAPVTYQFSTVGSGIQILPNGNSATVRATDSLSHDFILSVTATSASGQTATGTIELLFGNGININPLACNLTTGINNTAAAGMVSKIQVTVPTGMGVAPYRLLRVDSSLDQTNWYDANVYDLWQRASFRIPGAHTITALIGDAAGTTATCSAIHVTKAADAFAVATDTRSPGQVSVFTGYNATLSRSFKPFPSYNAGVTVAMGDFEGDGSTDLVVGAAPSNLAGVRVFHAADLSTMWDVAPFPEFTMKQVYVSAGDINGDGIADLVVGPGCNASTSLVRVFDGKSHAKVAEFLPYPGMKGSHVAVGDVNGDGYSDVVTSPCTGSDVHIYSGKNFQLIRGIIAYPNDNKDSQIAVGDVNGDGFADVIVGAHDDCSAHKYTKVFDGASGTLLFSIAAFPKFDYGSRVAVGDLNRDGMSEILIGAGGNNPCHGEVKTFDGRSGLMISGLAGDFLPFSSSYNGNVFLGAGVGGL
ncbi:MAG: VCBS repeat-containing protein [Deltaproteobacteria bacterium]|nr:VCBS repeat-containing protein [Deltaproteobacteria bacterium]MBI3296287.1 VCBS repeat-containing protein [Deltaproteobacteria bacterium]